MKTCLSVATTFALVWFGIFAGALSGQTTITYGSGDFNTNTYTTTTANPLTLSDSAGDAFQAGVIGGNGTVTKIGTARLILSGNNTYTGGTIVSAGTLTVSGTTSSSGFAIASGATLELENSSGASYPNNVTFSGAGTLKKTGSGTAVWPSSAATFALSSGALIDVEGGTLAGGSFANENWTNNFASLNVASGAVFAGVEANVRVDALTGSGTITSGYVGAGYANFTFGVVNGSGTFSGTLANTDASNVGSFVKVGTGTQILTGANTFTGGLTISGGTVQIGAGGTTGSLVSNITDNAALVFNRSDAYTYNGAISGSGTVTQAGTGTLALAGSNTYTGGTTLGAGTLSLGSANALGSSGTISFSGGTLQFTASNQGDYSSRFSTAANQLYSIDTNSQAVTFASALTSPGGLLTKLGSGTLTLSGASTYTGGTSLKAGTLALGSSGAIGSSGTISFSGGTLQFSANNTADYSSRFSTAASQAYALDTNGQSVTLASTLTSSGGTLNKLGSGTLILSGNNTFSGPTTISAGTLQIGAGGTSGSLTGNITNNAALAFNRSDAPTYAGAISGSGVVTQAGSGTLTLSGNNAYTGGTSLNAGTLSLGSGNAVGTSGTISFSGGTLQFSANNTTDYSSRFSSAGGQQYSFNTNSQNVAFASPLTSSGGSLTKSGAGTLTLSAANTYSGDTFVSAGTLALAGDNRINSSTSLILTGGTLDLQGHSQAFRYLGDLNTYGGAIGNITAGTISPGFQMVVLTSGTYAPTFTGSGSSAGLWIGGDATAVVTLNGTNDLVNTNSHNSVLIGKLAGFGIDGTGPAGTVKVGNPNALAPSSEIVNIYYGTLDLNGVSDVRAGAIVMRGASQSALINGNTTSDASYAHSISMQDTYGYGDAPRLGGAGNLTLSGSIDAQSGGLQKIGAGTLTFTGNVSSAGPMNISAGTLQIGAGGTAGVLAASNIVDNGALVFNRFDDITYSPVISGPGSLTKLGAGVLTLSGANTYTGTTNISAGTLRLSSSGSLSDSTALTVAAGATFDLNNITDTIGSLAGGGNVILGTGTLTAGGDNSSTSFSGVLSGTGGFTKTGSGTLTLLNANTYSGVTNVSAGTLQIGAGGTSGSVVGNITNNGALVFNRSDAPTYAGVISGTGSLTQSGSGTLTLSGANAFTGGTTISGGTLSVSADGNLGGSTGAIALNSGSLKTTGSFASSRSITLGTGGGTLDAATGTTLTLNGNITGSAGNPLTKTGSGTLVLAGTNTSPGGTVISAGTLQIGAGSTSGSLTGAITDNAELAFNRSDALTRSALISGSGVVTQAGPGTLTLSGNNTYTGGTQLNAGTLALGSANAIGTNGTITFGGGTLQFSANNTADYSSRFSTAANQAYSIDTNGFTVTLASALTSTGGSLTKLGSGTLVLSGTSTYSGATTISAGVLQIGVNTTSGAVAGNITDNATLNFRRSDATTYAGVISGSGLVIQAGSGTLTLTGANSYSGGTTLSLGTLSLGSPNAIGTNGTISFTSGALQFSANNTTDYSPRFSAASSQAYKIDTNGQSVTFASALTSSGGSFTKLGAGTLTLSAANTYTGATTVTTGTLQLSGSGRLADSSALSVASGATFDLNGISDTIGSLVGAGNVALGTGTLTAGGDNTSTTFSGIVSGAGGLTKAGTGTLTLSGANTYTGGTTLSAGTLTVSSGATLAGSTAPLTVNAGTLNLNNAAQAVGSLSGAGGTINFGSGHTLTIAQATNTTYAGALTGSGSLVKAGAGELQLTSVETYSGGTTISGGTLKFGVANALPASSSLTLSGGTLGTGGFNLTLGTLTLSASSTIDFGSGTSALVFANSSALGWTGTLSILNYTTGTDSLRFGTNSSSLTAAQLNQISFNGLLAQIDPNGFVSPISAIPEPSTFAALAGLAGLGFAAWRRRKVTRAAAA